MATAVDPYFYFLFYSVFYFVLICFMYYGSNAVCLFENMGSDDLLVSSLILQAGSASCLGCIAIAELM